MIFQDCVAMRLRGFFYIGGLLLLSVFSRLGLAQNGTFPSIELAAGMYRIEAEVATTQQERMLGLMQRKSMPMQKGMLFVFPTTARHCMWMRNTYLPLSVAFLDAQGRIINIEDMQPQTDDSHCAARPAVYALEMNLGWFRERGIGTGFPIAGMDRVPSGR